MSTTTQHLATPEATEAAGYALASQLQNGDWLTLSGELGAGKTSLVRGLLRGLGITGSIKSPTYSLVEHYQTSQHTIAHWDLYRIKDPTELDYLGWRDLQDGRTLVLIEWPEMAQGYLPSIQWQLKIAIPPNAITGRDLIITRI